MILTTLTAAAIAACPPIGRRVTCVTDGDTLWHEGVKLRLENIDTPEIDQAKCAYERQLGERAKARLTVLLNGGYQIHYSGRADRYRRPLVRVTVNGRDVGEQLMAEKLARLYRGRREGWC